MRYVQLRDTKQRRCVAAVDGGTLRVLAGVKSMRDLALAAIANKQTLDAAAASRIGKTTLDYADALSEGRILSPIDHPDSAHCLVTGTGLTHLGSAATRDAMHKKLAAGEASETDSIKMFKLGLEAGKPKGKSAGVQPEWFYKGDGTLLVAPGAQLNSPAFALDGGEEPEIAGLYVVAPDGRPWRLGFALGNEFSDHVTERQNYLYLAHSKLRCSSIGPELRTGKLPPHLEGESRIIRKGKVIWRKPFLSGEANMSHAIANLEYHHFKYDLFRRPGDVHIHYFGTATLSFADGIKTEPGDVFEIELAEFGALLRNTLSLSKSAFKFGGVGTL